MKPYSAYKDSGVEWLGQVPEGWEVKRMGACFDERRATVSDKDYPPLSVTMSGVVPQLETAAKSDDSDNRKLVKAGDFVINSRSDRKGSSGLSDRDGSVSLINIVLTPYPEVSAQYSHWLLRSRGFQEEFYRWGRGIVADLWSTRFSEMKQISISLPPLPEQQAIAAFLDRETAKIDGLIEEQRRLIALLAEKRQAAISHAVTRGLNPSARLKPSGVDWLGDIPEGWEVVRLRRILSKIEQGFSPECFAYPAQEGEWGVLKAGCVNRGVYVESENKALPAEISPRLEAEVKTGDILMSRASGSPELIGSVAVVQETQGRILLSDKIFRLRLNELANSSYVAWAMAAAGMRAQIINAISGGEGMANNLPQADIKDFWVALPPLTEQMEIANNIENVTAQLGALTETATSAITLLQERRAALISAAVTGKIDVRDLASVQEAA